MRVNVGSRFRDQRGAMAWLWLMIIALRWHASWWAIPGIPFGRAQGRRRDSASADLRLRLRKRLRDCAEPLGRLPHPDRSQRGRMLCYLALQHFWQPLGLARQHLRSFALQDQDGFFHALLE